MFSAISTILTVSTFATVFADQLDVHLIDYMKNETDTRFCSAETASFGSAFSFLEMRGIAVNAAPPNACLPLMPPPYARNDSQSWVALIARDRSLASGCPFDVKVLNAQMAGFDAVLVYNYEDVVLTMQPSKVGSKVHIPAAMVTFSCGVSLKNKYAYSAAGNRYGLGFELPFPFDFHIYVISFAVIIGVCLLLSLLVWGIKLYRDWRRSRRNRLPRSSLKKLKVKKFEKGTDPYDCCAICLEDFEHGEKLRILPCNHAYHTKCVDQWLLKSRSTCPVCKRRVFPRSDGDGDSEDDDVGASGGGGGGAASDAAAGADGASTSGAAADASEAAAASRSTSSTSLMDERTPLLVAVAVAAQASATSVTSAASGAAAAASTAPAAAATFDNAALDDSTCDETDADSVNSSSDRTSASSGSPKPATPVAGASSGGLSVEVFVHRSQDESSSAAAAAPAAAAAAAQPAPGDTVDV